MPNPITVNIISDDETTPLQFQFKKQKRTSFDSNPTTVFIIDDEPTPCKPSPSPSTTATPSVVPETPSVVPETPVLESSKSYAPIVRCNNAVLDPQLRFSSSPNPKPSGLICLESDEESEEFGSFPEKLNEPRPIIPEVENEPRPIILEVEDNLDVPCTYSKSSSSQGQTFLTASRRCSLPNTGKPLSRSTLLTWTNVVSVEVLPSRVNSSFPSTVEDDLPQVFNRSGEDDILGPTSKNIQSENKTMDNGNKKKTRNTKEEKARLMDEKKRQKEQEKLEKAALKAQAAEMKKLQKEIHSWEKGKFAQQSIMAKIDTKVVEQGAVGGQLLTRLAEKGISYQITSNPVERSIIWTMSVPEDVAQALSRGAEISYVLLIFEAEEFCRLVMDESLIDHVSRVQSIYPSHTICYLTNRLLAYINKREQEHYKKPDNRNGWRRPHVEQMLAKLTTHFVGVHSRLCTDEAELAEHVVGLTCSLASCQFRKKLTRLSVNANGSLIPKDADRALIKKSTWLKALIAIPKVQPRFAVAIWKKYPTMKSLLSVYIDPNMSEHEKEFLVANLTTEGLVGGNRRLGEVCSKRVYRILMAQSGTIKTDDVENGADFFTRQSANNLSL